jgi:hypothetical protein
MWIASFVGLRELRILSFLVRGFSRDIQHNNNDGLQPLKCPE